MLADTVGNAVPSPAWYHLLDAWRDFYIFGGGAAATLMGLMFVVVSLGRQAFTTAEGQGAIRGFFTPIVAFFATDIVITMLILVPYETPRTLGILMGALGIAGVVYMFSTGAHRRLRDSELEFDDWFFYFIAPCAGYLAVLAASVGIWTGGGYGLYVIAIVMALLLAVAIRNAWDLTVFMIQRDANAQAKTESDQA